MISEKTQVYEEYVMSYKIKYMKMYTVPERKSSEKSETNEEQNLCKEIAEEGRKASTYTKSIKEAYSRHYMKKMKLKKAWNLLYKYEGKWDEENLSSNI